jgi:uncharacterized protein with von Willebrand factor type A (vWA) domain
MSAQGAAGHLQRNLVVFGRLLRRAGIDVHVGRMIDVTDALQHVDLASRDEVYHTCRALLVHRHDQLAMFDRAFDVFWRAHGGRRTSVKGEGRSNNDPGRDQGQGEWVPLGELDSADRSDSSPQVMQTWSDVGVLADKDFGEFTPEEITRARIALEQLEWSPGDRRTRRWVAGGGTRIDLRRALARSLRTGGDVIELPRRIRRIRPRPLVLLCDVSGSMERHSRMLLHFAHALTRRQRRVEAFLFSTQLTRITMQLRARRVGEAVSAVSRAVPDWSGGTRIGAAIRQFHQQWTRRALRGSPVVLLISDGWDRGDPEVLRAQIARLQRSCHRLIWLNPLIGTVGYEPLTRGLQAALPYVDDFLPARTLTNLADLAIHLNTLSMSSGRSNRFRSSRFGESAVALAKADRTGPTR